MVITAIKALTENRKRKHSQILSKATKPSYGRDVEQQTYSKKKQTVLSIPGNTAIPTGPPDNPSVADSSSASNNLIVPGSGTEWPPFGKYQQGDEFMQNYRKSPLHQVHHHQHPQSSGVNPDTSNKEAVDHDAKLDPEVEHWYLDENAYTNEVYSKRVASGNSKHKTQPDKPHSASSHSHHQHHHNHHIHTEGVSPYTAMEFNCDPEVPHPFAEVVYAEQQLKARRQRPQYIPTDQSALSAFENSIGNTANQQQHVGEDTVMSESEAPEPYAPFMPSTISTSLTNLMMHPENLAVAGRSISIVPVTIAGGSASLGMGWTPAPARISLPVRYFNHFASLGDISGQDGQTRVGFTLICLFLLCRDILIYVLSLL
jgi:hypothetical protein